MKISSCLIIKNEAENLKKLIPQLWEFSDEVIIVDTGSEDKSKEIAKKLNCKVYDFKWIDDFSAARNFSFDKATNEWIFWCDGDDLIRGVDKIKKLVREADDQELNCILFEYLYDFNEDGNCIATHWKHRLIKGKYWRWEKTLHENLVCDRKINAVRDDEIKIVHNRTKKRAEQAAQRNIRIMLQEYEKDKEKTDPRTFYYLGRAFEGQENYKEALFFLLKHIPLCGWDEEKYFALMSAARCSNQLKDYQSAINLALEATKLYPNWPDAYFSLAQTYGEMEQWQRVIEWSEIGFTKKRPLIISVTNDLDYSVHPLGRYAYALLHLNKPTQALRVVYQVKQLVKKSKTIDELEKIVREALRLDNFVKGFRNIIIVLSKTAKYKIPKLFEALPPELDADIRLSEMRNEFMPAKRWPKKSVAFFCGKSLEDWADPSILMGIGGSESATILLAREFVKKDYKVVIYNQCGALKGTYHGVEYRPFHHFNPHDTFDTLIAWRSPAFFEYSVKARKKILWLHDRPFDDWFNESIVKGIDKIIVLSDYQRKCIPSVPDEKILVSANGLDMKMWVDATKTEKREPYKAIYSSSYDRGLENLLKIWPEVKKAVPEAQLECYYGWQGFDKVTKDIPERQEWKKKMQILMDQEGVLEGGRISQQELAKKFAQSSVWAYPSHFWEISCIVAMQAQATGAIPVTVDYAALDQTVKYGIKVSGKVEFEKMPKDVLEKFKEELIALLQNSKRQKEIRRPMMKWAQGYFTWRRVCGEWIRKINL